MANNMRYWEHIGNLGNLMGTQHEEQKSSTPTLPKEKNLALRASSLTFLVARIVFAYLCFCHFWSRLMVGVELWSIFLVP